MKLGDRMKSPPAFDGPSLPYCPFQPFFSYFPNTSFSLSVKLSKLSFIYCSSFISPKSSFIISPEFEEPPSLFIASISNLVLGNSSLTIFIS